MSPTMLTYINEESDVWRILFAAIASLWKKYRGSPAKNVTTNPDISHRIVIECRLCARYFFERCGISIDIKEPYTFSQYENSDPQADMVIAISQSGKSATGGDA